jgi:hypothetical protein
MKYRMLDENGDYTFGQGLLNFYIDSPQAVAQAVQTTLLLWQGEWYLNVNEGTPYMQGILGKNSQATADATIRSIILGVQGVVSLTNYSSTINSQTRSYSATGTLNTIYGMTQLQLENLSIF